MTQQTGADERWGRLGELVAARMGLHFPPARLADLQRGVAAAAPELGCEDAEACARWLIDVPLTGRVARVLARHLTIGETYFFRDRPTLDALREHILPDLIERRRGRERRLRFWSAACATGEEAYSLGILVRQLLPDVDDWKVTILATDVNGDFLKRAVAGEYGDWSFRGTPPRFRDLYFRPTSRGRHAIRPEIQRLVTFEHLNLVDDVYPSLATDTNAMDVILCRNVLMYFAPEQMASVVERLHRTLVEGGWLAVSPSETSQAMFRAFEPRNFPSAIWYRKPAEGRALPPLPAAPDWKAAADAGGAPWTAPSRRSAVAAPGRRAPVPAPVDVQAIFQQGRFAEAADALLQKASAQPLDAAACSLLTRALANLGRLAEALGWADRWAAREKLNAAAHYVRAVILLEQGATPEARHSLRRALFLDPSMVLGHVMLGHLAHRESRGPEALRHFSTARALLARMAADDVVPESDGLTVARLCETLSSLAGGDRRQGESGS